MKDTQQELDLLIRSRHPFIAVDAADERRVEALLDRVARAQGLSLYIWSVTSGMRRAGSLAALNRGTTFEQALESAKRMTREAVFLFKDLQTWLTDPTTLRLLLDLAPHFAMDRSTLVMTGPDLQIPSRLKPLCARWVMPLPTRKELKALVRRVVEDFSTGIAVRVDLGEEDLRRLLDALMGMGHMEAERAIRVAVADDLALTAEDIDGVLEAKREILRAGGVLEYVPVESSLGEVGGLENLKRWLARRRGGLTPEAREFGLPPPKGVILLGVQGCGKSLVCKAVAADWGLPLLRLEAGRIYDKFIGESDKNLEQALRAAEHMAPCVLMIDEIEKAFAYSASADSDAGLSQRIFGRLLNWLQERKGAVFVVATCNDISKLPPELVRKGRFDEIFFVDLPRPAERRQIFAVHIRGRGRVAEEFDLDRLAAGSEGFSGAEIEEAVVAGLYAAFAQGQALSTDVILQELSVTRPLSVTRAAEVEALRSWARDRAVLAGGPAPDATTGSES